MGGCYNIATHTYIYKEENPLILGVAGFKGSGKDTVANVFVDNGYQKINFADKLKDACATIFEWDREMLAGLTEESRAWREEVDEWWATRLEIPDFTPRLALQWMGTEAGRNVFGENVWTAALEKFILENPGDYVVPDVRFKNEVKCIRGMRGTVVRVKRGPEPAWYEPALQWNALMERTPKHNQIMPKILEETHPSEWDWIGQKFDHVIENDGTLEELQEKADELME